MAEQVDRWSGETTCRLVSGGRNRGIRGASSRSMLSGSCLATRPSSSSYTANHPFVPHRAHAICFEVRRPRPSVNSLEGVHFAQEPEEQSAAFDARRLRVGCAPFAPISSRCPSTPQDRRRLRAQSLDSPFDAAPCRFESPKIGRGLGIPDDRRMVENERDPARADGFSHRLRSG